MPDVDRLNESPWLLPGELTPDKQYVGTIKCVTEERPYRPRRSDPSRPSLAPSPVLALWLYEHPKPIRLFPRRAKAIAEVLGEKNTDKWNNQTIGFYAAAERVGDGVELELYIHPKKPGPNPTTVTIETSRFLNAGLANGTVPWSAIDRFCDHAKGKGKTWGDFVAWLKPRCREGHDLIVGRELDAINGAVVPAMKLYLDEIYGIAPLSAAPSEDTEGRASHEGDIAEEDIPF